MVNFRKLTEKAKEIVDKRGGTDSLKEDAGELREIAKEKGSLKDKARAAADALKDPGAPGGDKPPRQDAGSRPARGAGRAAGPTGAPHHENSPETQKPHRAK
jgi:hypothetical protein